MNIIFHSQSHGTLSLEEVIQEVMGFVKKEPERFYKIIIGTDSHPANPVSLVTALTIWRVGNGAIHFWTKSDKKVFHSMRDRIWEEAIRSITMAQEIRARLQSAMGDEFFWDGNEIHVDIGENGPTRELIDGVKGMIKGYNFEPIIKPYAFGASVVADRHT
ncbi:MAG: hypothetical protein G01um101433_219 [Parcubacteria group bacterium Gr01-1014_33]|nr:MAG: hypothetical protein G01um101433_219 [Parcubacteria group bacterium Gr01-1014_33]